MFTQGGDWETRWNFIGRSVTFQAKTDEVIKGMNGGGGGGGGGWGGVVGGVEALWALGTEKSVQRGLGRVLSWQNA